MPPTLVWLPLTAVDEPLYGTLGWRWAGADTHEGAPVTLMRKS
ncbi:MAG TPA: hypothetical protein VG848_14845 [Acetobacteraceae bacterium]|nr:hypothetical protein [Acetobacteraceae bacterium]